MNGFEVPEKLREKIANEIKSYIVLSGKTMKDVALTLHEKYGRSKSVSAFTHRIKTGKIRYAEVLEIMEVIGMELVAKRK